MLKRILKRMKIERAAGTFGIPSATWTSIICAEWHAFRMQRRAAHLAVRLVLTGAMTGGPR